MELFGDDDGSGAPLPDLCLDSPSENEAERDIHSRVVLSASALTQYWLVYDFKFSSCSALMRLLMQFQRNVDIKSATCLAVQGLSNLIKSRRAKFNPIHRLLLFWILARRTRIGPCEWSRSTRIQLPVKNDAQRAMWRRKSKSLYGCQSYSS